MNADHLDQLLLDRALGALPTEVAALLDEHLAHNPSAAQRASEYQSTTSLVREVLARDVLPQREGDPLPAFPGERIRRVLSTRRTLHIALQATGMAACLLIGFGLAALRPEGPDSSRRQTTPPTAIKWFAPAPQPTAASETFNSLAMVANHAAAQRKQPSSGTVIWSSPLKLPTLGERR